MRGGRVQSGALNVSFVCVGILCESISVHRGENAEKYNRTVREPDESDSIICYCTYIIILYTAYNEYVDSIYVHIL